MDNKNKKPFRGAVFGLTSMGQVVTVKGPTNAEDCGLYIHVDDIEKYEKWQKEQDQVQPASVTLRRGKGLQID